MRHRKGGFKLQRDPSARRALLRGLTTSVILHERIETTVTKAKAVRPQVDRIITLAKRELGLDIVERNIRRSELYLADEVFLTGTAAHVTPVGELDSRPIGEGGIGPVTRQIMDKYLDVVRGNDPDYADWCTAVPLESW